MADSIPDPTKKDELSGRQRSMRLAGASCICLVISVGIISLVMGLMGFFGYEDLCVGVSSFEVKDLDFASASSATSNSTLIGVVDEVTGGLGSIMNLAQVNLTLELILDVQNTNPYDMRYVQANEGTVVIPVNTTSAAWHPDDLTIGTWGVQGSTLKKNSVNQLTATLVAVVKLEDLESESVDLGNTLADGYPLVLRIEGGIEGSTWVVGLKGQTTFTCVARINNILNSTELGEDMDVRCRTNTRVGNLRSEKEEINWNSQEDGFYEEESCFAV